MAIRSLGIVLIGKTNDPKKNHENNFFLIKNRATETPTGEAIDVLFSPVAVNSCNSCLRPAGAAFNRNGHLLVSADTTNQLFRVAHNTQLPTIINVTL